MYKFEKLGTVKNLSSTGRKITITTDDKINAVCDLIKKQFGMSVRRVAVASNISKSNVQRITKSILNLYSNKIKLLHELKAPDYKKRIKFAEWFLSIKGIEKKGLGALADNCPWTTSDREFMD
jgi:hypothetical protein